MHELIADMPMDERPRERMLTHGAKSLSDAELLAVLLGSGIPEKNAIELARDLLREGIPALAQRDAEQLIKREGMGSRRRPASSPHSSSRAGSTKTSRAIRPTST